MMEIRNRNDLRRAYEILQFCLDSNLSNENVIGIKRSIRKFLKENNDRYTIKGDFDWYIELITLPDFIDNCGDAEEYFEAREYICPYCSDYDCTGRPFTAWHKVFKRNDRWMIYHCVTTDV